MAYCTSNEVLSLFGDLSDTPDDDLIATAIGNSTGWIDSKLNKQYVPIPATTPSALNTAAIYYSASDIILSLYHGEDLPVQYDVWFQKALGILDDYIAGYFNTEATADDINNVNMVKHSHSQSYYSRKRTKKNHRW